MSTYTPIITARRIDIGTRGESRLNVTTDDTPIPAPVDADLMEAVETAQISSRRALRIQATR